ncbi:MAG: DUF2834 domain-containing protein [Pseudomonadota bacterium]
MSERTFRLANIIIAIGFTVVFCIVVLPPLLTEFDVLGAFAAGFVNPYATGYSTDVFFCWAALAVWVVHEAREYHVRNGWICLVVGIVPGVAVGLALYMIVRGGQVNQAPATATNPQ